MMKINAIELAAGIGLDVEDEIRDLEALMEIGTEKAEAIRRQFNHISSLLTGMNYVIEYTEDDETRHELIYLIDQMRAALASNRRQCMEIIYTAKLGRKVRIQRDAPETWALDIAKCDTDGGRIFYGLKDLDAVKDAFEKTFG